MRVAKKPKIASHDVSLDEVQDAKPLLQQRSKWDCGLMLESRKICQ